MRLNNSHPIYKLLGVPTRQSLSPPTHATSNSFLTRVRALSESLCSANFPILCDPTFAEEVDGLEELSDPFVCVDVDVSQAVRVYTDGSALPNPGPCGCGVFFQFGSWRYSFSQYVGIGSNLMAELKALQLMLECLLSNREDFP